MWRGSSKTGFGPGHGTYRIIKTAQNPTWKAHR
jgi:hypothetical protein